MNLELLETLLREEEGSYLDFKREQYPFYGASDAEKAELLKDILTFANAWRRTTAYILVGVEEVMGGRSIIRGVTEHLKDNDLQQFVNSKTQRPVTFSYRAFEAEGKRLGIIEIPVQRRPFYLTRAYANLSPNTVYIRRGSSTDQATLDEIAGMGVLATDAHSVAPTLQVALADLETQTALGAEIRLMSLYLNPPLNPSRLKPAQHPVFGDFSLALGQNPHYYEDLVEYIVDHHQLVPVGFVLENTGPIPGYGVLLKATIVKQQGLRITEEAPCRPSRFMTAVRPVRSLQIPGPRPEVEPFFDRWELAVPFGNILPRSKVWTSDPIYVGAGQDVSIDVTAHLYAENLPQPLTYDLKIAVQGQTRPMTIADAEEFTSPDA